ncbi:hypothetical protein [Nonlabens marinus]|uniref:Uncharacterized protein n=1 Tax=Nonlabens marinus S1-08 TaxID=1454201 RepID=W8VQI9_9FLAO|nr:hypothetical protein [Nonlabens marinus]BAO55110.1 hypothetical protein NMS_1101 [Nonlabens marinus S1-08]
MKYLITAAVSVFLFSTPLQAQDKLENKTKETKVTEITQGGEKIFESKVVREEIQKLKFTESSEGSYEKDLDLDGSPFKVIKTVWIDNDMDNRYDKMIRLSYDKKFDEQVTFEPTADGLLFKDDEGHSMLVTDYGYYVMNSGQDDEILITVDPSNETY